MGWLASLVLTIQVISAIGIIVLVLLQQGKGADMGAAFGSGSSGSLFGATGSANFLSRTTAVLATIFFIATLGISLIATSSKSPKDSGSVMQGAGAVPVPSAAPLAVPSSEVPAAAKGSSGDSREGSK